jgi:hypothetical protein
VNAATAEVERGSDHLPLLKRLAMYRPRRRGRSRERAA